MPSRRRGRGKGGGLERVVLSAADLARTADALVQVLPMAIVEIRIDVLTPERLIDMLPGRSRTEKITRGAISLAGTGDKSSRAYKSARRRLERYVAEEGRQRRRPRESVLRELVKRLQRPHLPTDTALLVAMTADVIYVGQVKTMPAGGALRVPPRALGRVRDRLRAGDEQGAALELLNAWVYEYPLNSEPEAQGVIGNIERIEINLEKRA